MKKVNNIFENIPEITFSEARELVIKKKINPLTKLEQLKLNKFFFQSNLIVKENK